MPHRARLTARPPQIKSRRRIVDTAAAGIIHMSGAVQPYSPAAFISSRLPRKSSLSLAVFEGLALEHHIAHRVHAHTIRHQQIHYQQRRHDQHAQRDYQPQLTLFSAFMPTPSATTSPNASPASMYQPKKLSSPPAAQSDCRALGGGGAHRLAHAHLRTLGQRYRRHRVAYALEYKQPYVQHVPRAQHRRIIQPQRAMYSAVNTALIDSIDTPLLSAASPACSAQSPAPCPPGRPPAVSALLSASPAGKAPARTAVLST